MPGKLVCYDNTNGFAVLTGDPRNMECPDGTTPSVEGVPPESMDDFVHLPTTHIAPSVTQTWWLDYPCESANKSAGAVA